MKRYNLNRMVRVLIYIISIALFSAAPAYAQSSQKQDLIDFNLHNSDGTVTIKSVDRRQGFLTNITTSSSGSYKLVVYGENSKELTSVNFVFPEAVTNRTGDTVLLKESETTVTTLFYANAASFKVFDPQSRVAAQQSLSFVVNPENPKPLVNEKVPSSSIPLYLMGTLGLLLIGVICLFAYKLIKSFATKTPPKI